MRRHVTLYGLTFSLPLLIWQPSERITLALGYTKVTATPHLSISI